MTQALKYDLKEIASRFELEGDFLEALPHGNGHINDTYAVRCRTASGEQRYIVQRINHHVFKQPEKLMANVERVTRHARSAIITAGGDPQRETLNLIPTVDRQPYYRDLADNYWRAYVFIAGAKTYEKPETPTLVYAASRAFGKFQKLLSALPGERLHETIPDFHHTPKRFTAFVESLENDVHNRARLARPEIDFLLARAKDMTVIVDSLIQGRLPERVTHNDTKLNNVMIDERTGDGICVIDLDTVMPGSALYDFGDSARVGASTAMEDERDLSRVGFDLGMFDRLVHGYLDTARDFLLPAEVELLAFSAKLLTLECGLRFLTDYLEGDVYFKIHRPDHNLDRCRTQLAMVGVMERDMDRMNAIVEARWRGAGHPADLE